jgi:hypothetical protein
METAVRGCPAGLPGVGWLFADLGVLLDVTRLHLAQCRILSASASEISKSKCFFERHHQFDLVEGVRA